MSAPFNNLTAEQSKLLIGMIRRGFRGATYDDILRIVGLTAASLLAAYSDNDAESVAALSRFKEHLNGDFDYMREERKAQLQGKRRTAINADERKNQW